MIKSMQLFVAATCMIVFPSGLASDMAVQIAKQKNIKEPAISVYEYDDAKEQKSNNKDEIKLAKLSKITTTKIVEAPKKVENKKENKEEQKTETKQEEVIVVAKEEPKTSETTETKKIASTTSVTSRSSNSISSNKQASTTTKKQTTKKATQKSTVKKSTSTSSNVASTNTTTNQETSSNGGWVWTGKKLSRSAGVIPAGQTPSGYRETYYNLNMSGCIRLMGLPASGMGVRADGVKTYNGYVMVASPNLKAYPKGSYIKTTLGMGIVVDFCPGGSLDIAVTW